MILRIFPVPSKLTLFVLNGGSGFVVYHSTLPNRMSPDLVLADLRTPRACLGLNIGEFDDFAPLLGFVGNHFRELGWRSRQFGSAEIDEFRLHLRIGQERIDFLVEHID